jgi:cytochrome c5
MPHAHQDEKPKDMLEEVYTSGVALYGEHCQICHGLMSESTKSGASASAIKGALSNVTDMSAIELKDSEIEAIAQALSQDYGDQVFTCSAEDADKPVVAPDVIKPLAKNEYTNTVEDLFGRYNVMDGIRLDLNSLPVNAQEFDNVGVTMSLDHFRTHNAIAGKLSEALVNQNQFVIDSFGQQTCLDGNDLTQDCLTNFAENMAWRIYRRPTTSDDLEHFQSFVASDLNAREEAQLLLRSLLLSGDFLFHMTAYGSPPDEADPRLIELSQFELANRLAYALWQTMPDAELYDLARAGELKDPAVLGVQVDRLLSDERARQANARFYQEWLNLRSDLSPNLPPELLDGLTLPGNFTEQIGNEASRFVNTVTFDENGNFADLMESSATFGETDMFQRILPSPTPQRRPGLLWRVVLSGSSFGAHRNLIHTGAMLREKMLCEPLPPPPASVQDAVQQAVEQELTAVSSRQEVAMKTEANACQSCHTKINPLAFAGANAYDWIGRYITEERRMGMDGQIATFPVNTQVDDPAIDRPGEAAVDGPAQLAQALTDSKKAPACLVQKRYATLMGRPVMPEPTNDGCALQRGYNLLKGQGGSLKDMLKALIGPEFQYRRLTKDQ